MQIRSLTEMCLEQTLEEGRTLAAIIECETGECSRQHFLLGSLFLLVAPPSHLTTYVPVLPSPHILS